MGFGPCNRPLKIWESIGTPTPKMGVHLVVWRFIPSHSFALPRAWDVTPRLPSWPTTLQAFALVASLSLGLQQLHIIFNKWTFIDLMFNLMAICATWRVMSWNFIHTMNSFILILRDSFNNASTLLIKFKFIIPYFNNHRYTFCYCWFCFW